MTSTRCFGFLLFYFFHRVNSEMPVPLFRVLGSNIELGYCFGVDYIVVYRSAPEGDQLLGNSSANTPIRPPADLQGRIRINQQQSLLGLQINNLTHMDCGTYRKECWKNNTIVSQLTQQLFVCDEEVEFEEIIVKEGTTTTELLCNSTSTRLEGTSVRWYNEMYPVYKLTLFLDSSVSLKPLVEELQSVVEVRDNGALLVLNNSMLERNHLFYCLVIKGENCLSLQNMYIDYSESRVIYASQGDEVVLNCPSDGLNQHWDTPLGSMNDTSKMKNQMYISSGDKNFSLVISSVSDELAGEYLCISSKLEMQYSLVLCPIKTALPLQKFVGEDVVLNCDTDQDDHTVEWYRRQTSMKYELIYESNSNTFSIPDDLKGRLTLPNTGYSLRISNLEMKDEGLYFCVVLAGPNFAEDYDHFIDNSDEEQTVDEYSDNENWTISHKCIWKQDTFLIINNPPVVTAPKVGVPAPTNIIAGGVGIGLVVLIGVIVVVILLKKRPKASSEHSEQDINLKKDPSCTQRLTSDEQDATQLP